MCEHCRCNHPASNIGHPLGSFATKPWSIARSRIYEVPVPNQLGQRAFKHRASIKFLCQETLWSIARSRIYEVPVPNQLGQRAFKHRASIKFLCQETLWSIARSRIYEVPNTFCPEGKIYILSRGRNIHKILKEIYQQNLQRLGCCRTISLFSFLYI